MNSTNRVTDKKTFSLERLFLFLTSISISAIATYLAINDNTSGAATCYVAGMLFLVFSNIDRFTSFKGLGFEANTRELDNKIKEADAIIKQLKSLSTFASRAVVDLTNKTGRFGGAIKSKERYQYTMEVREHLEEMGVEKSEIRQTLSSWIFYSTFDLMHYIIYDHHGGTLGIRKMAETHRQELQNILMENCLINDPMQAAKREETSPKIAQIDAWLSECTAIAKNAYDFHPDAITKLLENVYWLPPQEKQKIIDRARPIIEEIASIRENLKYKDLDSWSLKEQRE
ncbi:hypothetical protein [Janthinobacterium sp. NKUCC06_STL]|uniref:hypothetical protein n=1 Tax=Janthinobacterium sp. NKUCC06_STL TaxID=2842127 RepID=UPI001C5B40AE|nr:hypothetical protein [Janthinobacterium sp. NKUCC06_STL]MBW3513074.1 hypothetical protein [Janthinobacterium sp. NKUCC06_STL]